MNAPHASGPVAAPPPPRLPDADDRERIVTELDRTLLVEASAGTGKTTALVARMVALLAAGRCGVETLAAVTFTRKAAAEIRGRLQLKLECAAREAEGAERRRLEDSLRRAEACFVGTIHAFCGRLLRERPVEAGVDPGFAELDDETDSRLRDRAWREHVSHLALTGDPALPDLERLGLALETGRPRRGSDLEELDDLGLDAADLASAFRAYAEHPDVDDWPAPEVEMPDLEAARRAVEGYASRVRGLGLPEDPGNDKLMPKAALLERAVGLGGLERDATLLSVLEEVVPLETRHLVQRNWPGGRAQALEELDLWNGLAVEVAAPLVRAWRERRYAAVMRVLRPARRVYDRLRAEAGGLNYADLLLKAAAVLRAHPEVRRYFGRRFTHLLVDEFQDTDPVQAEVMLLLTADDPAETEWSRCRPRPGSLFVVGDPKQSIYRFRRADVVTYAKVRRIVTGSGGAVVPLRANFRSRRRVVDWANACFSEFFPAAADAYRPGYAALLVGRDTDEDRDHAGGADGDGPPADAHEAGGVWRLPVPASLRNQKDVTAFEADRIARWVRRALDDRLPVSRTPGERAEGLPGHLVPADILIVARAKKRLSAYAAALRRQGVPHEVTGGTVLNEVPELALLRDCVRAVARPDDPVALLAVLRGELFGFSDAELYDFRRLGGRFAYRAPSLPADLEAEPAGRLEDAFARLRRYDRWLRRLPAVAAVERVAADLGLPERACAADGGAGHAGSLLKAVELLRAGGAASAAEVAETLGRLVEREVPCDGATVLPPRERPARVMNLHQCKGLEAAFVFLVDPSGRREWGAALHLDRSGARTAGYLAVFGLPKGDFGTGPLLAHPPDWERWEEEERRFLAAEEERLLYVAATRAGIRLVVSVREARNDASPWGPFDRHLVSAPELPDPGPASPQRDAADEFPEADWADSVAAVARRWAAATAPTYAVRGVKELTVARRPAHAAGAGLPDGGLPDGGLPDGGFLAPGAGTVEGGEPEAGRPLADAADRGTLIHVLLEVAMRTPGTDLGLLALARAEGLGLDSGRAAEAAAAAAAVVASPLWSRALAAGIRLVEVPFAVPLPAGASPDGAFPDGLPSVLRGVIDLAFREADGWVIVDYKSDRVPSAGPADLVERYRPQVERYSGVWAAATGEPVKEQGLFFTGSGAYVTV